MNKRVVIFAPHADDEIIGCFNILSKNTGQTTVLFNTQAAFDEAAISSKQFGFTRGLISKWRDFMNKRKEIHFFFPNPFTEYHPLHKSIGEYGLVFLRVGLSVYFYSTNMNTNNLIELENSEDKKNALNKCYPQKSDLWKNDWKYFLFEGYVDYNPFRIPSNTILL